MGEKLIVIIITVTIAAVAHPINLLESCDSGRRMPEKIPIHESTTNAPRYLDITTVNKYMINATIGGANKGQCLAISFTRNHFQPPTK
jgi:hypothetical protein